MTFDHIGDSNIHFEIKVGEGEQPEIEIEQVVYDRVGQYKGSISAEQGIGLIKRVYLAYSPTPEEILLMRTLSGRSTCSGLSTFAYNSDNRH